MHILRLACAHAWTHKGVRVCVCLSIFLWCATAGSDCPVFPFPLWLITRVPVNPWYHHRIKRRPPSPREPISSESRTQTEKLLDIFAGPGMVKTSGRKDAPWHHPAVGSLHFISNKTHVCDRKTKTRGRLWWQEEEEILDVVYVRWSGRKKVRDRDHIVMFHFKLVFSSCSGCSPAGVVTQNN